MRASGRFFALAGSALVLVALAAAASLAPRDAVATAKGGTLRLVAYSTPRDAYGKLIPAFQETTAGRGTSLEQSYGASGEQARAVVAGLKADVVTLSVVVFAVRNGNPKKIKTWNDLIKPGVEIVTPNVQTSGGAKWNVMAAYGAQRKAGRTHAQAVAYLNKLYDNIVSQDKSAREALQTFLAGRGDVLLAYENEAIFAQKKDQPVYYLIPKSTILIENPVAVISNSSNKTTAQAFVRFLRTQKAQRIVAQNGYRPVLKGLTREFKFPVRPLQVAIAWLGGWAKVDKRFFDPRDGIVTKIQRRKGG